MDVVKALLVVIVGVLVAGQFATAGNDVGTLFGLAVVAVGLNLLWHGARGSKRGESHRTAARRGD